MVQKVCAVWHTGAPGMAACMHSWLTGWRNMVWHEALTYTSLNRKPSKGQAGARLCQLMLTSAYQLPSKAFIHPLPAALQAAAADLAAPYEAACAGRQLLGARLHLPACYGSEAMVQGHEAEAWVEHIVSVPPVLATATHGHSGIR